MVQVETFISLRDYIKFSYSISFRNPVMLILASIYCLAIVMLIFDLTIKYIHPNQEEPLSLSSLIIPIVGVSIVIGIYRASKKAYNSSSCLKEPITYTLSEAGISSQGNGVNSDLAWSTIYKVEETKKWLIIYQNKYAASVIPKNSFTSQEQLKAVRSLISSQPNLKHKLSKD